MRKLLIVISVISVLFAGVYVYLNTYFFPRHFKEILSRKIEEEFERKITWDSIHFNFIKGLSIRGLKIHERDAPDITFINIREISFLVLIPNFFSKKELVIPSINIQEAEINIVRVDKDLWNFSDLLKIKRDPQAKPFPLTLLLSSISIEDSRIHFEDQSVPAPLQADLERTNLNLELSLSKGLTFKLQTFLPGEKSLINARGLYNWKEKSIQAKIVSNNLALYRYLPSVLQRTNIEFLNSAIEQSQLDIFYQHEDNHVNIKGSLKGYLALKAGDGVSVRGNLFSENFHLDYQKQTLNFKGALASDDLRVQVGEDIKFSGVVQGEETSLTLRGQDLSLTGLLKCQRSEFSAGPSFSLSGDIEAAPLQLALKDQVLTIKTNLRGAPCTLTTNGSVFTGDEIIMKDVLLSRADGAADMKAHLTTRNLNIHSPAGIRFEGNPELLLNAQYNAQIAPAWNYTGTCRFQEGLLKGIPGVGQVSQLRGAVDVQPDLLKTTALNFEIDDFYFELSGSLKDFKHPQAHIQAQSRGVDLEKLAAHPLLAPQIEKINIHPAGEADFKIFYRGPVASARESQIDVTAQLRRAALQGPALPAPLENISGTLQYAGDTLLWENFQCLFNNQTYTLNGKMDGFTSPAVKTDLVTDNLSLSTAFKVLSPLYSISLLKGKYHNTDFDLTGKVRIIPQQQPALDLKGQITLALKDLLLLFPASREKIQEAGPSGILESQVEFQGALNNLPAARISIQATSPAVTAWGHRFQSIDLQLQQNDSNESQLKIKSSLADGTLSLLGQYQPREEKIPFQAACQASGVELNKLLDKKMLKDKKVFGKLSTQFNLTGKFLGADTWTGVGNISIIDGYIWELNLFKGLLGVLLVPELGNIVFTEAAADFTVQDSQIRTQNISLLSKPLQLTGEGRIGFNQSANFSVLAKFDEEEILRSNSLRKTPSAILTKAQEYMEIRVTGTLKNPKYLVIPQTKKILKDTISQTGATIKDVVGGIGTVLEDILQ